MTLSRSRAAAGWAAACGSVPAGAASAGLAALAALDFWVSIRTLLAVDGASAVGTSDVRPSIAIDLDHSRQGGDYHEQVDEVERPSDEPASAGPAAGPSHRDEDQRRRDEGDPGRGERDPAAVGEVPGIGR